MKSKGRVSRRIMKTCSVVLSMTLLLGTKQINAETGGVIPDRFQLVNQAAPQDTSINNVIASEANAATESNAKQQEKAPLTYDRVLAKDTFENGDNWDVNNPSAITFHDGKAHIKAGGPNNRMGYKVGKIDADDFLIELDMTVNQGNTNSNAKIAFKAVDYDGQRLQLRFDFPKNRVFLETTKQNGWSKAAKFHGTPGSTYHVSIMVSGNTITAFMNGVELLSVTKDDIAGMERGYFVIAGQFPNQDFSIGNLVISTEEQPKGDVYTVTLKTAANGIVDGTDPVGGTLKADKVTGYSGDTITLYTSAKHGYVFDRYESFKADGSSTDGLMPITNNKFQLNEKFGDITVVAHFKLRVPGRFELFYDDFGQESLNADNQYKSIENPSYAALEAGELVLDVKDSSNWLLVNQKIFEDKAAHDGYRLSVDMRRKSSANGTVQIMFKGSDEGLSDRYALVINTQGSAMFRRFSPDGANTELKKCSFQFTENMFQAALEIRGNRVAFLVNGKEKMSYTDGENWMGMPDGAGLINMTAGAPVIFDNFLIDRIPETSQVGVSVKYEQDGVLTEDHDFKSGTARSSMKHVQEGDQVRLLSQAKAGWKLKGYETGEDSGVLLNGGGFTVLANAPKVIDITAVFEPESLREPMTFYLDSRLGSDSNSGTEESEPWKTLSMLSDAELVPGDRVLLNRNSIFYGEALTFHGMGNKDRPIIIDAYGEGNRMPRLNGDGKVTDVVSLYNQEYIEIRNLEITNTEPEFNSSFTLNSSNNRSKALRAVNVSIKDFGTASGIVIKNCYIHDINGNIGLKWNGGIFFDVQADIEGGELIGIPSKYDNILIEECTFRRVDRSGIKLINSAWCNQWEKNSPGVPVNWYPSTRVVVRNNYMEKMGGDGITVRDTDGALIEYNLVRDCRYQNTGYNVGIWPFEAANTVIQYNEVYDTHGTTDGQGLDCDHGSSYSVVQYNYSHNNEGGFMLIMGGYPHTAPTVRYNVSQNDRDKTFEFAQGIPKGTMVYNNTIYSDSVLKKGILFLSNSSVGQGVNDMYLFNNLFWYPKEQQIYGTSGDTDKLIQAAKFCRNAYAGGLEAAGADERAITVSDAGLLGAGSGPETNATGEPGTGNSEALGGYALTRESPMIDMGLTMDDAIAYFGGTEAGIVDGRAYSPRELFEKAKAEDAESIAYVMGGNFPEVEEVVYHADFFGRENLAGEKPDIGAAEFGGKIIKPDFPVVPEIPETPGTADTSGDLDDEVSVWTVQNSKYKDWPETNGSWRKINQEWQFLKPDGTPYENTWILRKGLWYWTGADGTMATRWLRINQVTYYFMPETGEMAVGWIWVEGQWYYMNEDGALLTDTVTPDGYYVDKAGKYIA